MPRLFKRSPGLFAVVAFCAIGAVALFAEVERQADGWGRVLPGFYAGPVSVITQPLRVQHDNLSRIDIWAYIDGGAENAAGDVLVRVTPLGAQAPIRESRIQVRHRKNAGETVTIRFAPIPDSRGKFYTLELHVLSGPVPYLFVGITSSDLIPAGLVSINGDASRAHLDLAMRPFWLGRGGRVLEHLIRSDPARLTLIADVMAWGFVIAFAISAVWSMHESQGWLSLLWTATRRGALLMVGIAMCALVLLLMLSGVPHV